MALEGGEDFEHCYNFEGAYSIPNAVIHSPALGLFSPIEVLSARFSAGLAAVGPGLAFFAVGAIWICAAGLSQMTDRTRLKVVLPAFAILVAILAGLQLWRPIAAERLLASAAIKETDGALEGAVKDVHQAMTIDQWLRLQSASFIRLGALYQKMHSPNRPEALFARGVALQSRGLVPEALFYYDRAAEGDDPQLRRVALIEKARLAGHYAGSLYKTGVIGGACHYWLVSIEAAPDKVNGFFGAGRAFRDMGDYSSAIKHFEPIFEKTSQPNLLADAESELGDCWYRLGHPAMAREYYMASRKWADTENFRALKSLTESYYK